MAIACANVQMLTLQVMQAEATGELVAQAEQRMGESLGCRGGSTQHRSLLQSHTINASNGTQDQPDNQAPPPPPAQNETGQGKAHLSPVSLRSPYSKTSISVVNIMSHGNRP